MSVRITPLIRTLFAAYTAFLLDTPSQNGPCVHALEFRDPAHETVSTIP